MNSSCAWSLNSRRKIAWSRCVVIVGILLLSSPHEQHAETLLDTTTHDVSPLHGRMVLPLKAAATPVEEAALIGASLRPKHLASLRLKPGFTDAIMCFVLDYIRVSAMKGVFNSDSCALPALWPSLTSPCSPFPRSSYSHPWSP
jgi:hypothetical protein